MKNLEREKNEKDQLENLANIIFKRIEAKGNLLVENEAVRKKMRWRLILTLAASIGSYTSTPILFEQHAKMEQWGPEKLFQISLALGFLFASVSFGLLSQKGPSDLNDLGRWIKKNSWLFFFSSSFSVILFLTSMIVFSSDPAFIFWSVFFTLCVLVYLGIVLFLSINPVFLLKGYLPQIGMGAFYGILFSTILRLLNGKIIEDYPIIAWAVILFFIIFLIVDFIFFIVLPLNRKSKDRLNMIQYHALFLADPERAIKSFSTIIQSTEARYKALKKKLKMERKGQYQIAHFLALEILRDYQPRTNKYLSLFFKTFFSLLGGLLFFPIWESLVQESFAETGKRILCSIFGWFCL